MKRCKPIKARGRLITIIYISIQFKTSRTKIHLLKLRTWRCSLTTQLIWKEAETMARKIKEKRMISTIQPD